MNFRHSTFINDLVEPNLRVTHVVSLYYGGREGGRGRKRKREMASNNESNNFFFFFLQIVCLGKTSSGLKTWLDEIIKAIFLVFQELVFNLFLH